MVLALKKVDLEGEYREQAVDIAAYGLDAVLLPSPYFG